MAEWHVSTTGNDSNPGSLASPFRTWGKINSAGVAAGDTVWIHAGTYNERFTPTVSGSAGGGYITFKPYSGGAVTLAGNPSWAFSWEAMVLWISAASYLRFEDFTLLQGVSRNGEDQGAHIDLDQTGCHHIKFVRCTTAYTEADRNTKRANGVLATGYAMGNGCNFIEWEDCVIENMTMFGISLGRNPYPHTLRYYGTVEDARSRIVGCWQDQINFGDPSVNSGTHNVKFLIEKSKIGLSRISDSVQINAENTGKVTGVYVRRCWLPGNYGENAIDRKNGDLFIVDGCLIHGHPGANDGSLDSPQSSCGEGGTGGVNTGSATTSYAGLIRKNIIYNNASAVQRWHNDAAYHNTIVANNLCYTGPNAANFGRGLAPNDFTGLIRNNIICNHNVSEVSANTSSPPDIDGNCYFDADGGGPWFHDQSDGQRVTFSTWKTRLGGSREANSVSGDPLFTNVTSNPTAADPSTLDFGLQAGSPAKNIAQRIATMVGAGTSATSGTISNVFAFTDGFGMPDEWGAKDKIIIGSNAAVTIQSITRPSTSGGPTSGTVTWNTAISWSDGDSVWLAKADNSKPLDAGAFDYYSAAAGGGTPPFSSSKEFWSIFTEKSDTLIQNHTLNATVSATKFSQAHATETVSVEANTNQVKYSAVNATAKINLGGPIQDAAIKFSPKGADNRAIFFIRRDSANQGGETGYAIVVRSGANQILLSRYRAGTGTVVASASYTFDLNSFYKVQGVVTDSGGTPVLNVKINDVGIPDLTYTDTVDPILTGDFYSFGISTAANTSARFKEFEAEGNPGSSPIPPPTPVVSVPADYITTPLVPITHNNARLHRQLIATALNNAITGKLNVGGEVTLSADQATTKIKDNRIGPKSIVLLMPVTANAAAAAGTTYVSARTDGEATVSHNNTTTTDRTFAYAVIG